MEYIDLVKKVMASKNDLGFFIAAWELMIEDPEYRGIRDGIKNQLEFLKYMNRNGCKTQDDIYYRLSNGLVDVKRVSDFVFKNYAGRNDIFYNSINEGYPGLLNFTKTHLN
jgi:hypothetical protein